MPHGIVIDAHLIRDFRNAIAVESGYLYNLLCWILDNCGIAITPLIENHWKRQLKANDSLFNEWFYTEYHVKQRIREIKKKKFDSSKMNRIVNQYGLANDIFVKDYIRCANSTISPRYILAEDMDFYEPKSKQVPIKTKKRIIQDRTGDLCCFLEDNLTIHVGSIEDFTNYFPLDVESCDDKASSRCSPCSYICKG